LVAEVAMRAKDAVGRHGEEVVARRLADDGWEVLERNWRCEHGEIDIVAVDGDCLVAVEVKTRRSAAYGSPQEAVTSAKLFRLRRLTAAWLSAQDRRFGCVRIDVCAVTLPRSGAAIVEHLRGVG
jgi:putative endonuclease